MNGPTRYELAAIKGDRRILVAYTPRRNRRGLLDACYNRALHLVDLTGADTFNLVGKSADGITLGEWTIRFTGRTQREALSAGPLPYIDGQKELA